MNKIYIEPTKSERKYRLLSKLGVELGIPVPECFLEMKVVMPDGKILHHHKQRSHSFTRNPYNLLMSQVAGVNQSDNTFGSGKLSMKSTAGVVKYGTNGIAMFRNDLSLEAVTGSSGSGYVAGSGDTNFGIQIGTGTNAESFDDYVLQALITNGTGAGQMSVVQSDVPVKSYDAGTKTWSVVHTRYFNNNSPGSITVAEVGIVGASYHIWSGTNYLFCRDILGAPVLVPVSGQLKVSYTFSLVYPA